MHRAPPPLLAMATTMAMAMALAVCPLLGSTGCKGSGPEEPRSAGSAQPEPRVKLDADGIRRSYEAFNAGKLDQAAAVYAPGVFWEEVGGARKPTVTRATLVDGWRRLRKDFPGFEILPRRIMTIRKASGDVSAFLVELVMRGRVGPSARSFSVPVAQLARVDGDLIVRSSIYRDSLTMQGQLLAPKAETARPERPSAVAVLTGDPSPANEAVVRRFYAAVVAGSRNLADLLAPETQSYSHVTGKEIEGVAAARAYFTDLLQRAPDTKLDLRELYSVGDWVIVALTNRYTATSKKPGIGGRKVAYRALQLFRITDGRISWAEVYGDRGQVVRALGRRPPPRPKPGLGPRR